MLLVSASGGLMSKLLPVQMSSAACWNRKAKPTVSSTWRSGSKPSGRRKMRSISRPSSAMVERRDRDRQQPRAGGPDHGQRDIAAEQEVGAVRQIDDPHHAENQRQAAAHQEQQRAVGNAVEGLDQPELRIHPSPDPSSVSFVPEPSLRRRCRILPYGSATCGYLRRPARWRAAGRCGGMIGSSR